VLTTGALPPHPGELLSSHVLPKILDDYKYKNYFKELLFLI